MSPSTISKVAGSTFIAHIYKQWETHGNTSFTVGARGTMSHPDSNNSVRRILVVDDNDELASVLEKTLHSYGYQTCRARDGNQALQIYKSDSIDIVLTDLIMPDKEGIELIGELRRLNPDVKVIAMSGGQSVAAGTYLKIAEKIGAVATLAKPFSSDELLAVLKLL